MGSPWRRREGFATGLGPKTFGLKVHHSNQLSYTPEMFFCMYENTSLIIKVNYFKKKKIRTPLKNNLINVVLKTKKMVRDVFTSAS